MYNFITKPVVVKAIRIGDNGCVLINSKQLIGDMKQWVIDNGSRLLTMSDDDFKLKYEPADDAAKQYLKKLTP